jgi:hypothetical protein
MAFHPEQFRQLAELEKNLIGIDGHGTSSRFPSSPFPRKRE